MKDIITPKERLLLNQLIHRINKISNFMYQQGIPAKDINNFFIQSIFEITISHVTQAKKQSKEVGNETEEETNSEASDCVVEGMEMKLEKVLMQKLNQGKMLDRVLLEYVEKCFVEQEKLKNYLQSQNAQQSPSSPESNKFPTFDFERIRERTQQENYCNNMRQKPMASIQQPFVSNEPSLTEICQINEKFESPNPRKIIEESQKELNQMRSFEKSLTESIRKTKMLRSMLEKQLAIGVERISRRGNDDRFFREEIL